MADFVVKKSMAQPFLLATYDGGYVISDKVSLIVKSAHRSYAYVSGGGGSTITTNIEADPDTVAAIFKEHGYDVVTAEDIKNRKNGIPPKRVPAPPGPERL